VDYPFWSRFRALAFFTAVGVGIATCKVLGAKDWEGQIRRAYGWPLKDEA
jgi:hypothetical protein